MDEKQLKELEHLKKTLRCVVLSSATVMDVRTLSRDYLSMEGERIPHLKFGYPSLLTFLKERCSDSLLFSGDPKNPVVTPVVTERTKHINDMVAKQKIPSTSKVKLKRSSVLESNISPKNDGWTYRRAAPKSSSHMNSSSTSSGNQENWKTKPAAKTEAPNTVIPKNEALKNETPKRPVAMRDHTARQIQNGGAEVPCRSMEAKKRVVDSENCMSRSMEKLSVNSRYTALYLNKIKSHLQELLHYNPNGIWLDQLQDFYREKFEEEIDLPRLGHADEGSLCHALPDVLRLTAPRMRPGRLLITAPRSAESRLESSSEHEETPEREPRPGKNERSQAHNEPTAEEESRLPYRDVHAEERHKATREREREPVKIESLPRRRPVDLDLSGDSDDAIPGPYDEGIFPEDCMGLKESIGPVSAAELEAGGTYEINVSEVLDPSHFWFQLRSDEHDLALDKIMEEMTEYYERGEGRDRVMAPGAVKVGQYCAANYPPDGWHRCIIVRIIDGQYVKVRQVDYGTVERVARPGLRVLPHRWAALPAQALRGCLASLKPAHRLPYWPHDTSVRFHAMVNCVPLVAQIHSVDTTNHVVRMYLTDTTGENDVYINSVLVKERHAEAWDMRREVSPAPPRLPPRQQWSPASSEVSESASALVGRSPRRMREWQPPAEAALGRRIERLVQLRAMLDKLAR